MAARSCPSYRALSVASGRVTFCDLESRAFNPGGFRCRSFLTFSCKTTTTAIPSANAALMRNNRSFRCVLSSWSESSLVTEIRLIALAIAFSTGNYFRTNDRMLQNREASSGRKTPGKTFSTKPVSCIIRLDSAIVQDGVNENHCIEEDVYRDQNVDRSTSDAEWCDYRLPTPLPRHEIRGFAGTTTGFVIHGHRFKSCRELRFNSPSTLHQEISISQDLLSFKTAQQR